MPGKVLFNQKRCVACHGSDPSGFIKARFTDKGRTVAVADVLKQLRTPFQKMPMFSITQVSDEQAGQIADYYRSLQPAVVPAPAAAAAPAPAPATLQVQRPITLGCPALGVACGGCGHSGCGNWHARISAETQLGNEQLEAYLRGRADLWSAGDLEGLVL
jgi:cytochrome c551/c552